MPSQAQMPLAQGKQILNMTTNNWVSFRNFRGQQLVYFTHLESWKCHIESVAYEVNNNGEQKIWQLQPCDPSNPNAVTTDTPYIAFPLKSVKQVSVTLTYKDGTKSNKMPFKP